MRCARCGHEAAEEVSSLFPLAQIHKSRGDDAAAAKLLERARQFGRAKVT
jgi:hypothetical protein